MKSKDRTRAKASAETKQKTRTKDDPFFRAERALVKVICHRFKEFRKCFGRLPNPEDPLFFVQGFGGPLPAPDALAIAQLKQAANECGVDFGLIRSVLVL